jgi:hypothetical protein
MADTPLEHDVLAEATNLTEVPTELPLAGLLTVTPAKAGIEVRMRTKIYVHRGACLGIALFSRWMR